MRQVAAEEQPPCDQHASDDRQPLGSDHGNKGHTPMVHSTFPPGLRGSIPWRRHPSTTPSSRKYRYVRAARGDNDGEGRAVGAGSATHLGRLTVFGDLVHRWAARFPRRPCRRTGRDGLVSRASTSPEPPAQLNEKGRGPEPAAKGRGNRHRSTSLRWFSIDRQRSASCRLGEVVSLAAAANLLTSCAMLSAPGQNEARSRARCGRQSPLAAARTLAGIRASKHKRRPRGTPARLRVGWASGSRPSRSPGSAP
jgi:hypothetical protein